MEYPDHPFCFLYEYVPSTCIVYDDQVEDVRKKVYAFKEGVYSLETKEWFKVTIEGIIQNYEDSSFGWTVIFIPPSNHHHHLKRYGELSKYLKVNLDCRISLYTLSYQGDRTPVHKVRKGKKDEGMPMVIRGKDVCGLNVIIIDDVLTRGREFDKAGKLALASGARSVYGVFFARTTYPEIEYY